MSRMAEHILAAPQSRFVRPHGVYLHLPLLRVLWARRRGCFDYSRPFLLSIENPLEPSMDVGRNSYNVARVQQACGHLLHTLLHRINQVPCTCTM
jgi:hypothetical protein